ncbi:MAG: hypothetical protein GY861_03395 [bacterium]|nr:hypothetical protein [bacterium]
MKYSLEDIMAAWAEYKKPLYFADGQEITEEEFKGVMSSKKIYESDFRIDYKDNYGLGLGFPEFLMKYLRRIK